MSQTFTANNETDLSTEITSIDLHGVSGTTYEIDLGSDIALTTDLLALNLPSGVVLRIEGNGRTIDGGGTERGFFAYAGVVTINDLTVAHAAATGGAGGVGYFGGGGGAGLGGGLFVASHATVTLGNVAFLGDSAVGGAGGAANGTTATHAGGGGLGGAGTGYYGGGGGVGNNASGGRAGVSPGPGIVPGVASGGGGIYSGGGIGPKGSNGGFGGGGGSGGGMQLAAAGAGGFGGGGAGSFNGAAGGFGGGGGGGGQIFGNQALGRAGAGGYGAGNGGGPGSRRGGGGLGAGGAVFVQAGGGLILGSGSIAGGSVAGGAGYGAGNAAGSGLFVQSGPFTLNPAAGTTLTIADDIADAGADPNGPGDGSGPASLVMTGGGRVVLSGSNSFTGGITIDSGTVELAALHAAGSGAVRFGGVGTLLADTAALGASVVVGAHTNYVLAPPIGLGIGDKLDIGLAYGSGWVTSETGNTLLLGALTQSVTITLDTADGAVVPLVTNDGGLTEILGTNTVTVTTEAQLNDAITRLDIGGGASAWSSQDSIVLGADIPVTTDLLALNLPTGASLMIEGNGHTINGAGIQRGFFAYAGAVTLDNLTIANAIATGGAGGTGYVGAGGGAGLGGGLFVGSGATVTLTGVSFSGDSAFGGDGGGASAIYYTSGGGLGGAGAPFGGGGGIGIAANGYSHAGSAGAGIVPGVAFRGGGGARGAGGGIGASGQNGGFGGGGAPTYFGLEAGGMGGFGGGGAGGTFGGNGGFGGGGGGATATGGAGGFGAGAGGGRGSRGGGGGLGAGGAVFVQAGGGLVLGSGSVAGGSVVGGVGGYPGQGRGSGLFVQGGLVTLDPAAGTTLTIGDDIADASGDTNAGDHSGPASLVLTGAGRVVLSGNNSFTGGVTLGAGALELISATASGSGPVQFNGAATLVLDGGALGGSGAARSFAAAIAGFGAGDTVDLASLLYTGTTSATVSTAGTVAVSENGTVVDLAIAGASVGKVFSLAQDGHGDTTVACFAEGTRIATTRGEVAVESLRVGDMALTAGGAARPVVWLGHRRTECARHPRPWDVMPVRVCADAFGPDAPARDLVLSPDHAVFVQGALIPVRYLLNGASVVQERVDAVTYWHVELDAHDVLLAEGLPCESYLDTGNRGAFANGDAVVQAHPDFARAMWAGRACAPLVTDGPRLVAAKRALLARLPELGFAITDDPALRVLVDGRVVEPQRDGEWTILALPDGARRLALLSRTTQPALLDPDRDDMRALGIGIRALRIDGADLPLDNARFGEGWHAAERGLRWSDGAGVIDVRGVGVLELLAGPALPHAVRRNAERRSVAAA